MIEIKKLVRHLRKTLSKKDVECLFRYLGQSQMIGLVKFETHYENRREVWAHFKGCSSCMSLIRFQWRQGYKLDLTTIQFGAGYMDWRLRKETEVALKKTKIHIPDDWLRYASMQDTTTFTWTQTGITQTRLGGTPREDNNNQ